MGRVSKRNTALHKSNSQSVRLYKVGIYARLSSEQDERKNESVDMQIEIAKKFVETSNETGKESFTIVDTYSDLGKTGTNFNRDEFARMMQDIRLGDVNCVIVKDLSRFGRNYLEAGNYIEKIFPFLGVRFIAITDGVDTGADGSNTCRMATEIKNLVNDMYAKDFSVKAKLHLQQRREQGSYVGGPPPYGYECAWEKNVRKLIPDENTQAVVKFIFDEFTQMKNYQAVTDKINGQRINPPSIYKKTKETYCSLGDTYKGWDKGSVVRILKNPVYTGNLEQGKTTMTARNEANRVKIARNQWVRKENTHKPLVEIEVFQLAKEISEKIHENTQTYQHLSHAMPIEENIFDSVLFCGVCGKKMTRTSRVKTYESGEQARVDAYLCTNGKSSKVESCPESNRITKQVLSGIILESLKTEFAVYLEKPKKYTDYGYQLIDSAKKSYEQQLRKIQLEANFMENAESESYMAYRNGVISQSAYVELKLTQATKIKKLENTRAEIEECKKNVDKVSNKFIKAIHSLIKMKSSKALTKDMVDPLIERIYLYPGKRVEIIYRYSDEMLKGVKM